MVILFMLRLFLKDMVFDPVPTKVISEAMFFDLLKMFRVSCFILIPALGGILIYGGSIVYNAASKLRKADDVQVADNKND